MKKRIAALFLALSLFTGLSVTAFAETYYGDTSWRVAFTSDRSMDSNFETTDLYHDLGDLQPGDNIIFTMQLVNENSGTTDWWMKNEVIRSLEDGSLASGGAYTYVLTYTDKDGNVTSLFDSDTVGGDAVSRAGEGLHEATDALKDFFYLDTLANGQNGTVTLEVALDGETQGNSYQDTLADLEMKFAVEMSTNAPEDGKPSKIIKTGDETNMVPYLIVMGVSGVLILALAIYSLKRNKKERGEEA